MGVYIDMVLSYQIGSDVLRRRSPGRQIGVANLTKHVMISDCHWTV